MLSTTDCRSQNRYYGNVRVDILPLLPSHLPRILEVGCGTGATLAYLKSQRCCDWVAGVEPVPAAAAIAREYLDLLIEGNAETIDLPIPEGSLDAILCLDVLEHLVDPWAMMKSLRRYLKPHGIVVASLPNVRFYKVLVDLVFHGRWTYVDAGILDRTHLRFFTRASAIELVECSGLKVDAILRKGLEAGKGRSRMNRLTGGLFEDLLTYQYLLRARAPLS